ncbi:MAG: hypothetical protein A3J12_11410, partial [Omnitrophica bacterium RIFCSPLOWO2_02_FULL_44_11]
VIIGRKGAYRGVHFSPEPFFVIDTAFYLKPKADIDIKWAYYELLTHDINSMDSGSAIPSTSRESFYKLPVRVPQKNEQRAIAHILGSLDDKIELNRKMNETLEAIARALFHSWFVAFDPVRRNIARKERGQPSPNPLPKGEDPSPPSPLPGVEGRMHYRGGYDFSGLVDKARELRNKQTPAETILWEMLRGRQFMGLKFRRQHQIGDYVADFYCHEHQLVIELDGGIHKEKIKKDKKRDEYLCSMGFTVLRFPNNQVLEDPQSVLEQIVAYCVEGGGEGSFPLPVGEGLGEGILPSPSGRRAGDEGCVEAFDALFPDSFEDSELGEIPKGWRVGVIQDLGDVICGKTPPTADKDNYGNDVPFVTIPDMHGKVFITKTEKALSNKGASTQKNKFLPPLSICVSCIATPGLVALTSTYCQTNQQINSVVPSDPNTSLVCYFALRGLGERIRSHGAGGSVLLNLNKGQFSALKVIVPPDKESKAFQEIALPILNRILSNERECETLAAIRDVLLPKLISGELRVTDAEKFLNKVI